MSVTTPPTNAEPTTDPTATGPTSDQVQAVEDLWALATAAVAARALHVVAELGVADHLQDTPRSAAALAAAVGAHPDGLERVLRLLSTHGIFAPGPAGWSHTERSRSLRSDATLSIRAFARMMGLPMTWNSLTELEHSVRHGTPGADLLDPEGCWGYLRRHDDETQVFAAAMMAKSAADVGAVLAAFDFSPFASIADIGGGRGHYLRAILDRHPSATGTLFDQPDVIATVDPHPAMALQAGDFFHDELPAADAYLLVEVLHDWADAEAAAILGAIARAARPGASVLIVEAVLRDDALDLRSETLDVIMLNVTGGRERTVAQLTRLLDQAGFRVERVADTASRMRIVHATAR